MVPQREVPVRADADALALALRYLIENAVKYSPGAPLVTVSVAPGHDTVDIAVRDRGAGIPPDEHGTVFRKFVRGSAAHAFNVKGTGIGLAMAQKIVEAHGGTIGLESEPEKGSTFTMRLPMAV